MKKTIIQIYILSIFFVYAIGNSIGLITMNYLAGKLNMSIEEFDHRYVRWFLLYPSMKDIKEANDLRKSRPVPEKIYY